MVIELLITTYLESYSYNRLFPEREKFDVLLFFSSSESSTDAGRRQHRRQEGHRDHPRVLGLRKPRPDGHLVKRGKIY